MLSVVFPGTKKKHFNKIKTITGIYSGELIIIYCLKFRKTNQSVPKIILYMISKYANIFPFHVVLFLLLIFPTRSQGIFIIEEIGWFDMNYTGTR